MSTEHPHEDTESSDRAGYRILGLSLFGPAPLGEVHLQWDGRLTAAYGLNGSGKTVLLNTIGRALSGKPTGGDAFVHVQIEDERLPDQDLYERERGFVSDLFTGLLLDLERRGLRPLVRHTYGFEPHTTADELEDVKYSGDIREMIGFAIRSELENDEEAGPFVEEIVPELLLSFSPSDDGMYIYASSFLGDGTPISASRIQKITSGRSTRTQRHVLKMNPSFRSPHSESLLFTQRPDWVPVPVCVIGHIPEIACANVVTSELPTEINTLTSEMLLEDAFDVSDESTRVSLSISERFPRRLKDLEEEANRFYASVLLRAPKLRVNIQTPQLWIGGQYLEWRAEDTATSELIPLESLSRAQYRWAVVAIQWALSRIDSRQAPYAALILDEPEDALHPQAIRHMTEGLQALSQHHDLTVTATHSPLVVSTPDALPLHVYRNPLGLTEVTPLEDHLRSDLDNVATQLEMTSADLMQIYQVVLLVQGPHDTAVLETVFGEDWGRIRTRIMHMSGTRNLLSVAGGDILLSFTNAEIVVVLDNATQNGIPDVWRQARDLAMDGKKTQALKDLSHFERTHRRSLEKEEASALAFAKNSIHVETPHRFHIYGLSERDIINYLDPSHFVDPSLSWAEVEARYRRARERGPFKDWLKSQPFCHSNPSLKTIPIAARDLSDHPPTELTDLFQYCQQLTKPTTTVPPGSRFL